jgi:glycosyltransferase involved in cell wall biosynthesis
VREVFVPGDPSAPSLGGKISGLGLDLYHSLHHFLPIGLRVPRVVLTLHDLIWLEHPRLIRSGPIGRVTRRVTHVYARAAIRHALRRADEVIAISAHSRSRALAYFGLDPARIEVVHHGVDHEAFPPASDPDESIAVEPYFLCLGNSRPYKNIATALRAFALFSPTVPEARLVVTGRGDTATELLALARRLKIDDRVVLTGVVDHARLLELLHGARALVFPSLVEGFGFPLLEAMAAGCPVVSSNSPTLTEVGGDAVLYCDPTRPEEFAAAMATLVSDRTQRADLRRRGIARAATFTWDACARATLAVYDRLLNSPTA